MSLSSLLGAVFGVGLFIISIFLSTSNIGIFFDFPSLLMVLGGAIATAFMSFQEIYVFTAFKAIWWMIQKPKSTREGLSVEIQRMIKWAYIVQKKGFPALESEIRSVQANDPIIKYCLELVITGHKPEELQAMMSTAVESHFEKQVAPVDVLKKMAAASPAFGMLGTLVGLIVVLQGMGSAGEDMMQLVGSGMSLALITTLYGVLLAQLIFLPAGHKLYQKEEIERFRNLMVIEGLVMLAEKRSPAYIQDSLNSFLDPKLHVDIRSQIKPA